MMDTARLKDRVGIFRLDYWDALNTDPRSKYLYKICFGW